MKKALLSVGILTILAVIFVIFVSKFVSVEDVSRQLQQKVREATGREISFDGAKLVFWPNIGVDVSNLKISNPAWAKKSHFIEVKKASVALAVRPLLQREIEIKRFVLDEPMIDAEVAADGRASWDFEVKKQETPSKAGSGAGEASFSFKMGEVQISKGSISYLDQQTGKSENLSDVNVTLDFPSLDSPLQLNGVFSYRNKAINVVLHADQPMQLVKGKGSPVKLDIKTADMMARLNGTSSLQGALFEGSVEASVASLSGLVSWLSGAPAGNTPFKTVSFSGNAQATKHSLVLRKADLKLDDMAATGDVTLGFSEQPNLEAKITLDKINLDRFMGGGEPKESKEGKPAGSSREWSDEKIDFSGLKAIDANVVLQTKGFSLKGADVGPSTLTAVLKGGNLSLATSEATLFDGGFSSQTNINSSPAVPTFSFKFNMKGVEAKPVLSTFANFKKLSGAADADVAVVSSGSTQREIIGSLAGNGSVVFRNGSLEGIDLADIAKMIQSQLSDMGVGQGKTDFVELGGTFTVASGVATNKDFKMKGPLVQATGEGAIDLPRKHVQYRVIPVLTASSAVENAKGIQVPVDIKGPFDNIKVKPDYGAMIQQALDNPDSIKDTAKAVKEQGKAIKNILKDAKKDPLKALGGILGGGAPSDPAVAEPSPAPSAPAPVPVPDTIPSPALEGAPAAEEAAPAP